MFPLISGETCFVSDVIKGEDDGKLSTLTALATRPVNEIFSAYLKKSTKHMMANVSQPSNSNRETVTG
jgi:hypothetical protein